MPVVEKALINSDIGIMPVNNGEVIRLCLPPVTEERRKQLVKQANSAGEDAKVSIRNARREAIDKLKKEQKNGLPEDVEKTAKQKYKKFTTNISKKSKKCLLLKRKKL